MSCKSAVNQMYNRATEDLWHGNVNDDQFYKNGITILEGIKKTAPEDAIIYHTLGFNINGDDINMEEVYKRIDDYDAFVVCMGEHVYSECKFGLIHVCLLV